MKALNADETGAMATRPPNYRVRPVPKSERRKEHRQKAFRRVEKSASLAITYPSLKALTVDLLYFDREIVSWGHGLRYRANMETAKSMLHFNCPSALCNGGGFDLSKELGSAVSERLQSALELHKCADTLAEMPVRVQHVSLKEEAVGISLFAPIIVADSLEDLARLAAYSEEPVVMSQGNILEPIPRVLPQRWVLQEAPILIFA